MGCHSRLAMVLASAFGLWSAQGHATDVIVHAAEPQSRLERAVKAGRIDDERLAECSGMGASTAAKNLLWAINDSGGGPFLYAMDTTGRSFGRVRVNGARNRDWEDLATFRWRGQSMILIADTGDNMQKRSIHTLYVVPEPRFSGRPFDASAAVEVAWRIDFSYPDKGHDCEAVAVDAAAGRVFIITKRDNPPLLFELPLQPAAADSPPVARQTAVLHSLRPSADDLWLPFASWQFQPTALDLSADGRAVVLTYRHAYLFTRKSNETWPTVFTTAPVVLALPAPSLDSDLLQREAVCFAADDDALYVTSEGRHAGIYRLEPVPAR